MDSQFLEALYEQLPSRGRALLRLVLEDHFKQQFTEFEKEILLLILQDYSVYEISITLDISIESVNANAHSIFVKLDESSGFEGSMVPKRPRPSSDGDAAEVVPGDGVPVGLIN